MGKPFITTASGRKFTFDPVDPESIDIRDIAHALGNLCRFTGHTSKFYSVAQHSIEVWNLVVRTKKLSARGHDAELAMAALLHDAAEAYLGDVSRPLKHLINGRYRELELEVEDAVAKRFGLPAGIFGHEAIKDAVLRLLSTEARDLLGIKARGRNWKRAFEEAGWTWFAEPLSLSWHVEPLPPKRASREFLNVFAEIEAARAYA